MKILPFPHEKVLCEECGKIFLGYKIAVGTYSTFVGYTHTFGVGEFEAIDYVDDIYLQLRNFPYKYYLWMSNRRVRALKEKIK